MEVSLFQSFLQAASRQLSAFQGTFTVVQSEPHQSQALVDAQVSKRQKMEAILAEVRGLLDDHASLLRSSHNMICYDDDRALHVYWRPLFDDVRKPRLNFALHLRVKLRQMTERCAKEHHPLFTS